nr:winged helix-turn-helix domain-containing protein [Methanocella sp. CWC-04]
MECAGRYYSVSILYGDEKDLRAQVDAVRAKISPSKVLSVLRPREPSISSLNLTGQDWRIIEYLLDDPRASEDKMSRDMGINVRTIQRRLERMITGGIVCSTVVVQPRLFEGLISYRFNILFNGAGKDAYADVIPSLNNYWYSLRLDSPEGVIVDLYRESISGIEEDIAIVKGISSVKDVTYTVPTRVITNDVLIRRKVIEAVFNKENV